MVYAYPRYTCVLGLIPSANIAAKGEPLTIEFLEISCQIPSMTFTAMN
jgi:hypothetical protein